MLVCEPHSIRQFLTWQIQAHPPVPVFLLLVRRPQETNENLGEISNKSHVSAHRRTCRGHSASNRPKSAAVDYTTARRPRPATDTRSSCPKLQPGSTSGLGRSWCAPATICRRIAPVSDCGRRLPRAPQTGGASSETRIRGYGRHALCVSMARLGAPTGRRRGLKGSERRSASAMDDVAWHVHQR